MKFGTLSCVVQDDLIYFYYEQDSKFAGECSGLVF